MLSSIFNNYITAVAFPHIKDQYHITPIPETSDNSRLLEFCYEFVYCVRASTNQQFDIHMEYEEYKFYNNFYGFICSDKRIIQLFKIFAEGEIHLEHEEQVLKRLYNYEDGFFNGPDAEQTSKITLSFMSLMICDDPIDGAAPEQGAAPQVGPKGAWSESPRRVTPTHSSPSLLSVNCRCRSPGGRSSAAPLDASRCRLVRHSSPYRRGMQRAERQKVRIGCSVVTQSTLRYLLALYRAQDALNNENDLSIVVRATARLRRVDPDQSILPALDAKIARLKIIAGLLDGTFCDDNVGS